MKVNGKMINNMGKVGRNGRMELAMLVNMNKELKMAKECLSRVMEASMKESFLKIKFMGMAFISGVMAESIMENGKIIK